MADMKYLCINGQTYTVADPDAVSVNDDAVSPDTTWSSGKIQQELQKIALQGENAVTPQMFGAKADGKTDDSAAIQAALDSGKLVYLPKGTYATTLPLVISRKDSIISGEGASIQYSGAEAAVKVMAPRVMLRLETVSAPNGTGLEVDGADKAVSECNMHINRFWDCVTGFHVHTAANPITNNIFRIDRIYCRDIGVLVWADASYISENWYYLGKINGGNVGAYLHGAVTNYFIKGSFEDTKSALSDPTERTANLPYTAAIWMNNASSNRFYGFRTNENIGEKVLSMNGRCCDNLIELSAVNLEKVDISGLTDENYSNNNIIRSLRNMVYAGGGCGCGPEAQISRRLGIVYDTSYWTGSSCTLNTTEFENNIIVQLPNRLIPTTYYCVRGDLNGLVFTLGELFSHDGSPARGRPLVFHMGSAGSAGLKLQDADGQVIFDNADFTYADKSVSVRWAGYNARKKQHLWDVKAF